MTFDQLIPRHGTSSLKWDWYKDKDIIPLWVADMDFPSSRAIIDAIKNRADHGIFGYTLPSDGLYNAIIDTLKHHYHWSIQRDWIVFIPGVVSALNTACMLSPKKEILVPRPVYPPFLDAPKNTGHCCVPVDMIEQNGRLVFDPDRLQKAITDNTGMLLLCSPHNPGGTVFTKNELMTITDICQKNNILICSDEIHCGLVLDPDTTHIPTASLSSEISKSTITLMAPSKTYNIPGLGCSFVIIEDKALRQQFNKASRGIVPHVNLMGLVAAEAAYSDSQKWHAELLACLRQNRQIVFDAVNAMPGLRMLWPESTYLAWIDTREAGIDTPGAFFEAHGVGLSDGTYFGQPGFVRLNFGCTKKLLEEGLKRMANALKKRFYHEALKRVMEIQDWPVHIISEKEDIPPYYTTCPNPWIADFIKEWEKAKSAGVQDGNSAKVEDECGWLYETLHVEPASSRLLSAIGFQPCDPFQATKAKYRRDNLPHIQVAGATYFITFRTEKFRILSPEARELALNAIRHWDNQRWKLISTVVMPDHVHLIARPLLKDESRIDESRLEATWESRLEAGSTWDISDIMHSVKSFSANKINQIEGKTGTPVWQTESYDRIVRDARELANELAYLNHNPVRAGLVEKAENYVWRYVAGELEKAGWKPALLGTINYTVWSDVFICPECAGDVVFWETAVDKEAGKVKNTFPCPHCQAELTKRKMDRAWITKYDSALKDSIRQAKQVPVLINYSVEPASSRPKRESASSRPKRESASSRPKIFEKSPDKADLALIDKIEKSQIPYWFPTDRMMEGKQTRKNDPAGITHVHHFYPKRTAWELGALWDSFMASSSP